MPLLPGGGLVGKGSGSFFRRSMGRSRRSGGRGIRLSPVERRHGSRIPKPPCVYAHAVYRPVKAQAPGFRCQLSVGVESVVGVPVFLRAYVAPVSRHKAGQGVSGVAKRFTAAFHRFPDRIVYLGCLVRIPDALPLGIQRRRVHNQVLLLFLGSRYRDPGLGFKGFPEFRIFQNPVRRFRVNGTAFQKVSHMGAFHGIRFPWILALASRPGIGFRYGFHIRSVSIFVVLFKCATGAVGTVLRFRACFRNGVFFHNLFRFRVHRLHIRSPKAVNLCGCKFFPEVQFLLKFCRYFMAFCIRIALQAGADKRLNIAVSEICLFDRFVSMGLIPNCAGTGHKPARNSAAQKIQPNFLRLIPNGKPKRLVLTFPGILVFRYALHPFALILGYKNIRKKINQVRSCLLRALRKHIFENILHGSVRQKLRVQQRFQAYLFRNDFGRTR